MIEPFEVTFEWDEAKRDSVLAARGVDFRNVVGVFDGTMVTRLDRRSGYGELRFSSVGRVDGNVFATIYTVRGTAIRLITAWKIGRADYGRYQALLG